MRPPAAGPSGAIVGQGTRQNIDLSGETHDVPGGKFNHANNALWEAYEADEIAYKDALAKIRDLAMKDLQV